MKRDCFAILLISSIFFKVKKIDSFIVYLTRAHKTNNKSKV